MSVSLVSAACVLLGICLGVILHLTKPTPPTEIPEEELGT